MTTLKEREEAKAAEQTPAAAATPGLQLQPIDDLERYRVIDYNVWRCLRLGQVSGSFYGQITSPTSGNWELDLRVDIDTQNTNTPVTNRISGDLYQVYKFSWGGRTYNWRIYRTSWRVDSPAVSWSGCSVGVSGNVTYLEGSYPSTTLNMTIPWSYSSIGAAQVTLQPSSGTASTYSCTKKSNTFRQLTLEVDVCSSVNSGTILPTYNTHAHNTRPTGLTARDLTIEQAYREAGVEVNISSNRTIIDDSAATFNTWSDAELHDAMETNHSAYAEAPQWQMWGVLAGNYVSSSVAGIMFDYGTAYGGPGRSPERQGFAVFRNHSWFNSLPNGAPANQTEATALRQFLYCWVHEAGHAFNFLHSWNKGRSNALSWMNYPQYVTNFWNNFMMRFDEEELIHLRHGKRSEVIMGGDPWATGSHLEETPNANIDMDGNPVASLLIRGKNYYHFMEPVTLEFRLKNNSELPLDADTQLDPACGRMDIYIKRPDGKVVAFDPVACKLAAPEMTTLQRGKDENGNDIKDGTDRISKNITLSFGKGGFYFQEPGEYTVRAVYHGSSDLVISSNAVRLRIGRPFERDEERLAQDYFSPDVGLALYFGGSSSRFLSGGMNIIEDMADRFASTALGAHLSLTLATNQARPFHHLKDGKMVRQRDANPDTVLNLTKRTLDQYKKDKSSLTAITFHECCRLRAEMQSARGNRKEAESEIKNLLTELGRLNVKPVVLERIKAFGKYLK